MRFLSLLAGLFIGMAPLVATAADCQKLAEVCVEGPATKLISGNPIYRDCWKFEASYTCLSSDLNTSECDELRDRGCGQISSTCIETSDTGCSYYENLFQCQLTAAETATVADCGTQTFCLDGNCFDAGYANDTDFAQVVATGCGDVWLHVARCDESQSEMALDSARRPASLR